MPNADLDDWQLSQPSQQVVYQLPNSSSNINHAPLNHKTLDSTKTSNGGVDVGRNRQRQRKTQRTTQ